MGITPKVGRRGSRCKANRRRPCPSIGEEAQRSRWACAARNPKGARGLRPLAVFLVVVDDQASTSSSCLASTRSSLARDRARLLPRTARRGNTPRRGPLTRWTYCSPLAAAIGKEFAKVRRVVAQFRSGHGPIPVLFECYRIRTDSGMPRLDIRFSTSHLMMASTR